MPKVYLSQDEAFPIYDIYEDDFMGVEVEIPQELIDRYKKVNEEYDAMQKELAKYYKIEF